MNEPNWWNKKVKYSIFFFHLSSICCVLLLTTNERSSSVMWCSYIGAFMSVSISVYDYFKTIKIKSMKNMREIIFSLQFDTIWKLNRPFHQQHNRHYHHNFAPLICFSFFSLLCYTQMLFDLVHVVNVSTSLELYSSLSLPSSLSLCISFVKKQRKNEIIEKNWFQILNGND